MPVRLPFFPFSLSPAPFDRERSGGDWVRRVLSALLACLLLPGCQRKLTDANLACVKTDMSPKEVESILGPPNSQETAEIPLQADAKTLPVQRYIYEQNGQKIVIHFVDGKMVDHDGSFNQ